MTDAAPLSSEQSASEQSPSEQCPSEPPAGAAPAAVVTVCPDGPLLIRGDFAVVDATGAPIPGSRRTTALCRCGRSSTKPYCDGSHKAAGFRAP